mmetsp:Transcript_39678/g.132279  ORF Transcript_39678/g.132279 Transcript_39678/m.132279 type:complete len:84 (+) Transcript_39678:48-299(+)
MLPAASSSAGLVSLNAAFAASPDGAAFDPNKARALPERKFSSSGHAVERLLRRHSSHVRVKNTISNWVERPVPPRCPQQDCML